MDELIDLIFNFERLLQCGYLSGRKGTKEAMRWKVKIKGLSKDLGITDMKPIYRMVDQKKKDLLSNK